MRAPRGVLRFRPLEEGRGGPERGGVKEEKGGGKKRRERALRSMRSGSTEAMTGPCSAGSAPRGFLFRPVASEPSARSLDTPFPWRHPMARSSRVPTPSATGTTTTASAVADSAASGLLASARSASPSCASAAAAPNVS